MTHLSLQSEGKMIKWSDTNSAMLSLLFIYQGINTIK